MPGHFNDFVAVAFLPPHVFKFHFGESMMVMEKKKTLGGLLVKTAMRRQVISLSQNATIDNGITSLIKYKINAFLTMDENSLPTGVVSKTDVMGAYYAGLPLETPLDNIMSSPPLFCSPGDSLESALDQMRSKGIYRLYVIGESPDEVVGALAYPDIVGLLYQYCHDCEYSHLKQKRNKAADRNIRRYKVKEVMTPSVKAYHEHESLMVIMEELSKYRFGAVLINDRDNIPRGVVSKTDLALSYKRSNDVQMPAEAIMSFPVSLCEKNDFLEDAVQKMIFTDIHRLFVHKKDSQNIVGVLSLTDAARIRSGSCHACVSSRIRVDDYG
jgi:CBS domain-containing protein